MRLYTVLQKLIERTKPMSVLDLVPGTDTAPRTISPSVLTNGCVVKSQIQTGYVSGTNVAANTWVDVSVTFPDEFAATPRVFPGFVSESTVGSTGSVAVSVYGVTTTGFTMRFFNASSVAKVPAAYWFAISS